LETRMVLTILTIELYSRRVFSSVNFHLFPRPGHQRCNQIDPGALRKQVDYPLLIRQAALLPSHRISVKPLLSPSVPSNLPFSFGPTLESSPQGAQRPKTTFKEE